MNCRSFNPALLLYSFAFVSCGSNSADAKLAQMEIIIGKWEYELRSRPIEFDDMVFIQTDITVFDVNPEAFAIHYGTLSPKQKNRILELRKRFKYLMRKNSLRKIN